MGTGYGEEKKKKEGPAALKGGCMVSVSCITFNHGRYLRKALDSFLMQETDFPFEVLIHDDASSDDTVDIIREYEQKYPDIIKPLYEKENQYSRGISNISGVFNFPRARGRYIAMCEGDDYWSDPGKLKKQTRLMEAHPEYSMCCHSAGIVNADGAYRSEDMIRPFSLSGELGPEQVISKKTNIPTASLFFRTEYARKLPEWYYSCPVGDIPLQLFMLMNGGVYYSDEPMSMYRIGREGSWQELMDEGSVETLTGRWEAHYSAMASLYGAFDRDSRGKWHNAVDEALKRQRFQIDLKEGKAAAVLDPENALFVSELPRIERNLQRLKALAPSLYELIRRTYILARGKRRE